MISLFCAIFADRFAQEGEHSLAQESVKSMPAKTPDTMSKKYATIVAIIEDAAIETILQSLCWKR